MIMRRVAIMVATAVAVCLAGQSVYVQVKTGQVRETPSFLGGNRGHGLLRGKDGAGRSAG